MLLNRKYMSCPYKIQRTLEKSSDESLNFPSGLGDSLSFYTPFWEEHLPRVVNENMGARVKHIGLKRQLCLFLTLVLGS